MAFSAQPLIATAGTAFRPADLVTAPAARVATAAVERLASLRRAPGEPAGSGEVADRRARYHERLAGGLDAFLEPRRPSAPSAAPPTCRCGCAPPTCCRASRAGSASTSAAGCGTVFQNPRLTIEGLGFYYRDFYDGVAQEQFEVVFAAEARPVPRPGRHRGAAHRAAPLARRRHRPRPLLPRRARGAGRRPRSTGSTSPTPSTRRQRRGWVGRGYRGMFPELAPRAGRRSTTWSACTTTSSTPASRATTSTPPRWCSSPGGLLEIEVPDPEGRARPLARAAVGALLPAPAPAADPAATLRAACWPSGDSRSSRSSAAPPTRTSTCSSRAGLMVDGPAATGRRALGDRPRRARRLARNAGLAAAHRSSASAAGLDTGDLAVGQAPVAEHLPGAGPLRRGEPRRPSRAVTAAGLRPGPRPPRHDVTVPGRGAAHALSRSRREPGAGQEAAVAAYGGATRPVASRSKASSSDRRAAARCGPVACHTATATRRAPMAAAPDQRRVHVAVDVEAGPPGDLLDQAALDLGERPRPGGRRGEGCCWKSRWRTARSPADGLAGGRPPACDRGPEGVERRLVVGAARRAGPDQHRTSWPGRRRRWRRPWWRSS